LQKGINTWCFSGFIQEDTRDSLLGSQASSLKCSVCTRGEGMHIPLRAPQFVPDWLVLSA
jgi:hypothetical protein